MPVTIKDVAEASGVCQATVSQVLNNGGRPVHPDTRERVMQAVRALDYRPSAVARGLARKRMNTIGLGFQHVGLGGTQNIFMTTVLDGVLSVSTQRRQNTMLCTFRGWEAAETLPDLSDGRCDGVLLLIPPMESPVPRLLRERKVPIVVVNAQSPFNEVPSIDVDNVSAAREMTEYLLGLGHRRIAFLLSKYNLDYSFAHERLQGYREAMTAAGVYDPALEDTSFPDSLALDLTGPNRPTAIFCCYDAYALTLMDTLKARGIRVPEDMSVVGFDDIPTATASKPGLTTVRQPMNTLGERAAEMLLDLIEGKPAPAHHQLLSTELVIRDSAAPPSSV